MRRVVRRTAVQILVLACWTLARGPAEAATVSLAEVCGPDSVLSLVGVDTATGSALFGLRAGSSEDPDWLLEIDAAGREVRLFPDWSRSERYSGSMGPGPVLALERCGDDCRQVVRWATGDWLPLGPALRVSGTETVHLTWDRSGTPWVVRHEADRRPGRIRATAHRLAYGEAADSPAIGFWEDRGTLLVRAVGSPAVAPDPAVDDAILSGTGRFRAAGPAEGWLRGLPAVPDERRGQVLPLAGAGAWYLAGDGAIYLSDDDGRSWRAMTWTPWSTDSPAAASPEDLAYVSLDRPVGSPGSALELLWFDERLPGEEKVVLTDSVAGSLRTIAEIPSSLDLGAGPRPLEHVLRLGPSWLLMSGCASPVEGAGLVLRSVEEGAVSPPRLAPFEPAWLGE